MIVHLNFPDFDSRDTKRRKKNKIIRTFFLIIRTKSILIFHHRQTFWQFTKPYSTFKFSILNIKIVWQIFNLVALSTRSFTLQIHPYIYFNRVVSRKDHSETNKMTNFFIKNKMEKTLNKAFKMYSWWY